MDALTILDSQFPGLAKPTDEDGSTLDHEQRIMNAVRILVVEDDGKIASFVVKGLQQSGYAVDHSPDGERALALAKTISYDAAIVDLMLPELDGLSLIREFRA